ncbi:unnamed protein product [Rhizopus stolonifer]
MFSLRSACAAINKQRLLNVSASRFSHSFNAANIEHNTYKTTQLFHEAFTCAKRNQPDKALIHIQTLVARNLCSYSRSQSSHALDRHHFKLFGKQNYINRQSPLPYFIMDVATEHGENLETVLKIHDFLTPNNIMPTPEASKHLLTLYRRTRDDPDLWAQVSPRLTKQSFFLLYRALFIQTSRIHIFADLALELLRDLQSLGHQPTPELYGRVLARLKRLRAKDRQQEWIEAFKPFLADSPPSPDRLTGQALEAVYEGHFEKCLTLIRRVVNSHNLPNTSALTSIMEHARHNRRHDVVRKVYDLVIEPVSQSKGGQQKIALEKIGSAALISFAQQFHLKSALECFQKLKSQHVLPNSDAYGALMNCLPDEDLDRMYREAKGYYVRLTPYFFNIVISRFAKQKNYKRSIEVFKDMKRARVRPNHITFAAVISACLRVKAENQALAYVDMMVEADLVGTSAIHSLMKFYTRQRDQEKALSYYAMCEQYNLVPTKNIYKELMMLYIQSDVEKAYQVLREMKRREVQPDAGHYAVLINAYGNRQRDLSSALMIFNEMKLAGVEPDDNLYQVMASVYSKNGDYEKAQEYRYKIVKE